MAQREIVVEEDISGPGGEAESDGWLVHKVKIIGKRGAPDRWHFKLGRTVLIEYKKLGLDATAQQKKRHREFAAAGIECHVCDTHDAARRVLALGRWRRVYG